MELELGGHGVKKDVEVEGESKHGASVGRTCNSNGTKVRHKQYTYHTIERADVAPTQTKFVSPPDVRQILRYMR